jgi:hypothetical protein
MRSGSESNDLIGTIVYGAGAVPINQSNTFIATFVASVGDSVDLLYYEDMWYIKAIIGTSDLPVISTSYESPLITNVNVSSGGYISVIVDVVGNASNFIVGMCWNGRTSADPAVETDNTYHTVATSNTDNFDFYFDMGDAYTGDFDDLLHGRTFVLNSRAISYGAVQNFAINVCLVRGTMIEVVGGQKMIENIAYDDELIVWDFDNGCFATAKPLWIKRSQKSDVYNKLTFSDGTILCTVSRHRIFNKESGSFTYPMTDATPIGTTTFT